MSSVPQSPEIQHLTVVLGRIPSKGDGLFRNIPKEPARAWIEIQHVTLWTARRVEGCAEGVGLDVSRKKRHPGLSDQPDGRMVQSRFSCGKYTIGGHTRGFTPDGRIQVLSVVRDLQPGMSSRGFVDVDASQALGGGIKGQGVDEGVPEGSQQEVTSFAHEARSTVVGGF